MATVKRDIELPGGQATIKLNEESLLKLIRECVEAIHKTHNDFTYI